MEGRREKQQQEIEHEKKSNKEGMMIMKNGECNDKRKERL